MAIGFSAFGFVTAGSWREGEKTKKPPIRGGSGALVQASSPGQVVVTTLALPLLHVPVGTCSSSTSSWGPGRASCDDTIGDSGPCQLRLMAVANFRLMSRPELLAPAGSLDAVRAAVANGA